MKPEFQAKFLQLLGQRQRSKSAAASGFTLLELLIVIAIVGILGAIALYWSFSNRAKEAKQSEARMYVGSVNRAQQDYRSKHPDFATNLDELKLGIPNQTSDYQYSISAASESQAQFHAVPKDPTTLRAYAGGVMVITTTGQVSAAACQTTTPAAVPPAIVFDAIEGVRCGSPEQVMQ